MLLDNKKSQVLLESNELNSASTLFDMSMLRTEECPWKCTWNGIYATVRVDNWTMSMKMHLNRNLCHCPCEVSICPSGVLLTSKYVPIDRKWGENDLVEAYMRNISYVCHRVKLALLRDTRVYLLCLLAIYALFINKVYLLLLPIVMYATWFSWYCWHNDF